MIRHTNISGFEAIELVSGAVSVAVMPELGAKIVHLVHRKTGREWMWRHCPSPDYERLSTGHPFDQGPLVGADECLPTIASCRWRGLELTDHGEVWTEAWEVDRADLEQGRLTTRLQLPISPLEFQRTLTLQGATLWFEYELQNLSHEPFEYLWAFHPMMNIEPGDRILLPSDCTRVQTELCMGDCPLGQRGDWWNWPQPVTGLDLACLNLGGPGRAVKLFTPPLTKGWAAIVNHRTGESLTFEFDVNELDTLGIWINRGGFGGYQHVALEPTNGAPDALDVAVEEWHRFRRLQPGERARWSFRMIFEVRSTSHSNSGPRFY